MYPERIIDIGKIHFAPPANSVKTGLTKAGKAKVPYDEAVV